MRLPEKVTIIEVGPRDGFQNVKDFIATEDKKRIIDSLVSAGIQNMEITSFVHPKAIPQMAEQALKDNCTATNPRVPEKQELEYLYKKLCKGGIV